MPMPKKPAVLHKKNGTYRPGKHGGPSLPVALPEPPPDLSPGAAAHWHVIGRQLTDAGLISPLDGLILRLLCDSVSLYVDAHDKVREQGFTETTDKGNVIQNPVVGTRKVLWNQVFAAARQFGMTPVARTGMHIESKQEDEDVSQILGFKTA